jgi:hypothetical protein
MVINLAINLLTRIAFISPILPSLDQSSASLAVLHQEVVEYLAICVSVSHQQVLEVFTPHLTIYVDGDLLCVSLCQRLPCTCHQQC